MTQQEYPAEYMERFHELSFALDGGNTKISEAQVLINEMVKNYRAPQMAEVRTKLAIADYPDPVAIGEIQQFGMKDLLEGYEWASVVDKDGTERLVVDSQDLSPFVSADEDKKIVGDCLTQSSVLSELMDRKKGGFESHTREIPVIEPMLAIDRNGTLIINPREDTAAVFRHTYAVQKSRRGDIVHDPSKFYQEVIQIIDSNSRLTGKPLNEKDAMVLQLQSSLYFGLVGRFLNKRRVVSMDPFITSERSAIPMPSIPLAKQEQYRNDSVHLGSGLKPYTEITLDDKGSYTAVNFRLFRNPEGRISTVLHMALSNNSLNNIPTLTMVVHADGRTSCINGAYGFSNISQAGLVYMSGGWDAEMKEPLDLEQLSEQTADKTRKVRMGSTNIPAVYPKVLFDKAFQVKGEFEQILAKLNK